jgi:hypothetical protein
MRAYVDRQITRLWMWLVAPAVRADRSMTRCFAPGDEERLIQALTSMNDVLARAVRF